MEQIIEEIPLIPLEPAKIYAYHYDKATHEFLYKQEAEIDKQATKRLGNPIPLLPAYATLKPVTEFGENEVPVYSSHTEQKTITEQVPVYDEETGEIISYEEQEKTIDVLVEEWIITPDYRKNFYKVDDSLNVEEITTIGEQTGFYIVDKATGDLIKQNPDKFKILDGEVVAKTDDEYKQEQAQLRQAEFERDFFLTSLGFIRRQVNMATGSTKDFLSDLLPTISMAVQGGQEVPIITYKQPDFTEEFTLEYMESLQEVKNVTEQFIQECALQISKDFMPVPLQVKD